MVAFFPIHSNRVTKKKIFKFEKKQNNKIFSLTRAHSYLLSFLEEVKKAKQNAFMFLLHLERARDVIKKMKTKVNGKFNKEK